MAIKFRKWYKKKKTKDGIIVVCRKCKKEYGERYAETGILCWSCGHGKKESQ